MPLRTLIVLAGLALSLRAAETPPNFVFILADDCTYLDLEVYGGQAKTPHLNQLAKEGLKFSRCFQAAPMCSPTRHNLYTGIYPVKSGAWPNHTRVYPGTKSIAHYLKDEGYAVHLSGKSHVAPRASFPFDYSKDFAFADPTKPDCYPKLDTLFKTSAKEGKPFCLFACSKEPHAPFNKGDSTAYPPAILKLPPSWVDTPETRNTYSRYLAEITYFDQQCGALLKLLDQHGLRENTLVMVASEQGSQFPFAKWTCYELGLASGLIARWPGKIEPSSSTDALVEYVDITPTLIDAAGGKTPESLDGQSFLPVLLGAKDSHKKYTFGIQTTRGIINGSEHYAVRSCGTSSYRYIRNLHASSKFKNIVTNPRKGESDVFWPSWETKAEGGDKDAKEIVERFQQRPTEELYHVAADPHCLVNLIDQPEHTSLKKELSRELDRWMKDQGDLGHVTEDKAGSRQGR